ncbi:MAG: hypothetical protein ACKV22_40055 [Bryobacteraceae bacterium]
MRHPNVVPTATPKLIFVAIAEESARHQVPAVAGKPKPPCATGRLERVIRFGDWREQLAPQLAHPEQLRDDHLLRCEVALAPASESRPGFRPVDPAVAGKLGLPPFPAQFALKVAEDPTRAASPPPRTLIPERFRKPWEFQVSREEVLSQMARDGRPSWRERLTRFLNRREAERATDRWQGQLEGKPLMDQLWGVRPPRAGFQEAAVQKWVESTLSAAGWDPTRGRREWEIFWRRKGV